MTDGSPSLLLKVKRSDSLDTMPKVEGGRRGTNSDPAGHPVSPTDAPCSINGTPPIPLKTLLIFVTGTCDKRASLLKGEKEAKQFPFVCFGFRTGTLRLKSALKE